MKHKMILKEAVSIAMAATLSAIPFSTAYVHFAPTIVIAADNDTSETLTYNGMLYYVSNDSAYICGHTDDLPSEFEIPWKIDGLSVVTIKSNAFKDCTWITRVTLSNAYIEDDAFSGCEGLTLVGKADSYAAYYAQQNGFTFEALPDLVYNGMIYELRGDEISITGHNDELPAVLEIPAEIDGVPVTDIGQMAFYNCDELKEVTIPDTITMFGFQNFLDCGSLETVHLPEGLTAIHEAAFANCTALTSIDLPDGLTTIGNLVFSGCTSLAEINIPASVVEYGEPAFDGTPWLEAKRAEDPLVIVNGVLIDGKTAQGSVTIPDTVWKIAPFAFSGGSGTSSMTSVTIPDSVKEIGTSAFGCDQLTEVNFPDTVIQFTGSDVFSGSPWLEAKRAEDPVVIVCGSVIDAKTASGAVTIPDGVQYIGSWTFANNDAVTEVTLPESVVEIGRDAFYSSESLAALTVLNPCCAFPDSAESISTGHDDDWNAVYSGTIYGYDNSTAQEFAEKYGYTFESLGRFTAVRGDANGDGEFNVSDVVLLQKWLLAVPNTRFADWKAVNLCDDDRLDVFDLCLMKRALIYGTDK